MAISETITIDAGPAIGALDELAAAAARADEALAKLKVPSFSAAGVGNMARGMDAAAAKMEAAVAKMEASFAKLGETSKAASASLGDAGKVARDSAAGLGTAAKTANDAAVAYGRLDKAAAESSLAMDRQAVATRRAGRTAAESAGFFSRHKEAILGTAIVLGYSVDKAMKFNAEMTLLNTQAGVSAKQMPQLTKGVLELAGATGQSPGNLAESLYHVASNMESMPGTTAVKMLNAVKIAAEGAATGHSSLVDTTTALTSVLASGISGPKNYSQAMGILNATVGVGEMNMQQLADALSTGVVPVVKGYGLNLKDVGAALADYGDLNIRGAKAGTELRMAVQALAVQSPSATKELKSLGLSAGELGKNMRAHGLLSTLNLLDAAFKKHGITAQNEGGVITELFGKKAGAGLALLLENMDRVRSKYPALTDGANKFGEAWKKTQDTAQQKLKQVEAGAQALAITAGNVLMPAASGILGGLNKAFNWVQGNAFASKGLALGAGTLVAGGLAKGLFSGIESGLSGLGKIGKVLRIPGLDKLANLGKSAAMDGAAAKMSGAGATLEGAASALEGAAASLEGAAASLKGAGVAGAGGPLGAAGKGAGAAGGEAAAAAEGAGGAAAAGGIFGKLFKSMDFAGLRGAANPIIAGVTAGLMLRGFGDSLAKKGTPAGAMNNWLQGSGAPGNQAMNHYFGGLESWFAFSHAGLSVGRFLGSAFSQKAPAPPPSIPVGAAPAAYSRFGSSAAPQAGPVVKPKIQPPDTGQLTASTQAIAHAMEGALHKPVKVAAPDTSALNGAKGKAQADAQAIAHAMEQALHKPVKATAPDISAYRAAAGPARADGASISAGLAAGILAGEGAVVAAAHQVAAAAAAAMAHAVQTHSPSKVTEKTGKNMDAGLVLGLQGGQSAVDAAAAAVGKSAAKATDIAAIDNSVKKLLARVPHGDTTLTAMLRADNRALDNMARTRSRLEQEISDSEQVAKSAVSGASIMNALNAQNPAGAEPISSYAIVQGQQYQAASMKQFAQSLVQLQKAGLNATALSQIAQAGPDQGLGIAQGILSGGPQAIKQLNQLQKQLQASAAQVGNVAGPAMYQAGKDIAKGLAAGLKSELASLDKAMETLAKSMVASVSKHGKAAKHAAHKAGAGITTAAGGGGTAGGGGSAAGGGPGSLDHAAASLSAAGTSLSAAATALSAAAAQLQKHAGGGSSGVPGHIKHPVAAGGGYGGGGHYGTPYIAGPHGAQHVHYHQNVTVHGSVTSERDLLDVMQQHQLTKASNNWQGGWKLPGRAT